MKYYVSKAPLFLHITGAICCLGFSAIFHLFKDHKPKTAEWLVRLDYAGISLMIAGSNMPPLYYSFYCEPLHGKVFKYSICLVARNVYMTLQSVSCFLVFAASLWPQFDKAKYRVLRGTLFVILGLVAVIPFTHMFFFMYFQSNIMFTYIVNQFTCLYLMLYCGLLEQLYISLEQLYICYECLNASSQINLTSL